MYYIIYKTTNQINGKIYIGKHRTKDINDGYLGSGKLLRHAVKKYGIENFSKEILFYCKSEDEMNSLEKELVTEEFCQRSETYNLCVGGKGGFSYVNRNKLNVDLNEQRRRNPDLAHTTSIKGNAKKALLRETNADWANNYDKKISESLKIYFSDKDGHFTNKSHSSETKKRMSISHQGKHVGVKNSQFGTYWITNGIENKKVRKDIDFIPQGWYKGRVVNLTRET